MKALCVFAHPDDEIIWGWPVIQDVTIERHLITISDNRPGYNEAKTALQEVCDVSGVHLVECLDYPSEYYRLPTRNAPLTLPMLADRVTATIKKAIVDISPDFIFTHNPFGEYGHGDHRLIFNIVCSFVEEKPIVFTDACQSNKCHLSFDSIPSRIQDAYFNQFLGRYRLNLSWFDIRRLIYRKYNAWSWGEGHVVPDYLTLFGIGYESNNI